MATGLKSTRPGIGRAERAPAAATTSVASRPPTSGATASAEPAVRLDHVSRVYRVDSGGGARRCERTVQALQEISLRASPGELLAVVGPSGCGKTTLLELICDLQRPDAGTIRSEPAALMPQRDLLLPWLSALDNAALALRIARRPRTQARARAQALFAELGLAGFEHARARELSGGMRQRVAFLRTLLSDKPVLCLDEPFGALDAITRAEMQSWLDDALRREPRTVVLVTHDVEEAVLLADRVVVMSARPGRIVAEIAVDLARPRLRTDPTVVALRERALLALSGRGAPEPADAASTANETGTADGHDTASTAA